MAATNHTCPRCAAMVRFEHEVINIAVCNCGASLLRQETGMVADKPFEILFNATEPLQPGSTGRWNGKAFRVLGRIRCWFEDTLYNYWTILFEDDTVAWLGEGYGLYTIFVPGRLGLNVSNNNLKGGKVGHTRELFQGPAFLLTSKGNCLRWELEGAVHLPGLQELFTEYAFSSPNGRHVRLFTFYRDTPVAFECFPVSVTELALEGLRDAEAPATVLPCAKCGAEVRVHNAPYAISGHCAGCGRHLLRGKSDGQYHLEGRNETDPLPDIPVGSRGNFKGIDYEVVGYALKEETRAERSRWREYVLWNRLHGYAFLSEFDGHWIYLREREDGPVIMEGRPKRIVVDQESYQLFNQYGFSVVNAEGSFPYDITSTHQVEVREFISPPELWSAETQAGHSINWFWGESVKSAEVGASFGVPDNMPPSRGMGMVEPSFYLDPFRLGLVTFLGILFLLAVHLITGSTKEKRDLLAETFYFGQSDVINSTTGTVRLPRASSNVEVRVYAPVSNSWASVEASLINRATGKEYGTEQGVEFYSGYDGGESWSEGSRKEESYITAIPAGEYVVQVQAQREHAATSVDQVSVRLTYDVQNTRNLVIPVLLLLVWPLVQYHRVQRNEKARWENSPFTPYTYENE